jgi:hypothetical protein
MNNDREANHKIVKMTKHFISISNSDSNDYGTASHNPANNFISFNNPGVTNIQSSNDSTVTELNPISLSMDIFYNNVSQIFRNNKFRVRSVNGTQIRVGATFENAAADAGLIALTVTIPDGIYKTGDEIGLAISVAINSKLIAWVGGNVIVFVAGNASMYSAASQSMLFRYTIDAPAGIAAVDPILFVESIFVNPEDNQTYDSSRIWGIQGNGRLNLPYANRAAGIAAPAFTDVQTLQTIRVKSSIAKRSFAKSGPSASAAERPLTLTNTLFQIPLTEPLGSTFLWFPPDSRYQQIVSSNFDELTFVITDKNDNIVPLNNNAEVNFQFCITRDIIVPTNEQRLKSIGDYNQFRTL